MATRAAGGSTPLTLTIHISVSFLFFTISGTAHFTLGYIQLPQPVYLGGDNTDSMQNAQQWTPTSGQGQPLYLNVGQYQSYRNIGTDATSDTYEISQVGGSAGDATIQVTAFGRTEQFSDVSSVVANWSGQDCAGGCQMFVDVDPSVKVPVTITGGPGENIIDYEGSDTSGNTTIYGGSGTNIITDSGTGIITINDSGAGQAGQIDHAGPGMATIVSGNYGDTILTGPSATDQVSGGMGNDLVIGPATSIDLGGDNNQIFLTAGRSAPPTSPIRTRRRPTTC